MKKLIPITDLPLLVTATGFLGAALRLWQILRGEDAEGLLISGHPAGILQLVLLAAVILLLAFYTRGVGKEPGYSRNFSASPLGAVGTVCAAVGIFVTALWQILSKDTIVLDYVSAVTGIVAGPALLLAAKGRLEGKKVTCLAHVPACLFLALWLFTRCRVWGAEPEIWRFFPDLAAVLTLLLAAYHLTTFDVNLGERKTYLFWALLASYCCIAALPGSENKLLLLCGAVWMLTNLCALRLRRKKAAQEPAEEPVQSAPQAAESPIAPLAPEFEEEKSNLPEADTELDRWLQLIEELEKEE